MSYTKLDIGFTVPDTRNVCSKKHLTNSKCYLFLDFLAELVFFMIIYTKEVYGFVGKGCDAPASAS